MVDFCDKCGALVMGEKGSEVPCPACGHKNKATTEVKLSEKVNKKKETEVIDSDNSAEVHPLTSEECPECGHPEAYYWTKQTRAGDEPETQFFKCPMCKHQWREYR